MVKENNKIIDLPQKMTIKFLFALIYKHDTLILQKLPYLFINTKIITHFKIIF